MKNQEITFDQVQARLPELAIEHLDADNRMTQTARELRFPLGHTVECRLGPDEWMRGKVVGHFYREHDWSPGQQAPYQVLLEGDDLAQRTVWAPADTDECIRGAVRFATGTAVECCVGESQWVRGVVVAHYHREDGWPAQLLAPYRVKLDVEADDDKPVFIWAPIDTDECIRAAAAPRQLESRTV